MTGFGFVLQGRARVRVVRIAALALSTFLAAGSLLRAESVALTTLKDNTLYESATGSLSNGAGPVMFAGRTGTTGGGRAVRALLEFDIIGAIPAGATITSVQLQLRMGSVNPIALQVDLHRVLKEWGQGTSSAGGGASGGGGGGGGAPATTGDATWIHAVRATSFWSSPGGDFDPTPHGGLSVGGIGFHTWTSTPQMVADVQSWLDNPTDNHGWMLKTNEVIIGWAKRFDTRENSVIANRPRLTVDYVLGPTCDLLGDLNGDDAVNAADIQQFAECVVTGASGGGDCDCADADCSGDASAMDIDDFVTCVLNGACPCAND